MAARAEWRREQQIENDMMLRMVDPEFSGSLVCPITPSGRMMQPVKKDETKLMGYQQRLLLKQRELKEQEDQENEQTLTFQQQMQQQQQQRQQQQQQQQQQQKQMQQMQRQHQQEQQMLQMQHQQQHNRNPSSELGKMLGPGPRGSMSEGSNSSDSFGLSRFSPASSLSSYSSSTWMARVASEAQMPSDAAGNSPSLGPQKPRGKLPLAQMLRQQQEVRASQRFERVSGSPGSNWPGSASDSPSSSGAFERVGQSLQASPDVYAQMEALYTPSYSGYCKPAFGKNPSGKGSPGGLFDSPATKFSIASSGGSNNWDSAYSPTSSTDSPPSAFKPQRSFPPSPYTGPSSANGSPYNSGKLGGSGSPGMGGGSPLYQPHGTVPFGGIGAEAAAAAAAAARQAGKGPNCPEAAWLKEQQLMMQHQQYLRAQQGGMGGGEKQGQGFQDSRMLVRVNSNASTESGFSASDAEEAEEFDFSDIRSECINFSYVEAACQTLDLEKKVLDGINISPLPALRLGGPNAPDLVLYALYVDGKSSPMLPGDDGTKMLFPEKLQRAAKSVKDEKRGPLKPQVPMQRDQNGWVSNAKPSLPEYSSFSAKSKAPADELEEYLFG